MVDPLLPDGGESFGAELIDRRSPIGLRERRQDSPVGSSFAGRLIILDIIVGVCFGPCDDERIDGAGSRQFDWR